MGKRKVTITLTVAQARDVLAILSNWQADGYYFGPKDQFDKRLDAVLGALMEALDEVTR